MSEYNTQVSLSADDLTEEQIEKTIEISQGITDLCLDNNTNVCLQGITSALGIILAATMDSLHSVQVAAALVGAHAGIGAAKVWDEVGRLSEEQSNTDTDVSESEGADSAGS